MTVIIAKNTEESTFGSMNIIMRLEITEENPRNPQIIPK